MRPVRDREAAAHVSSGIEVLGAGAVRMLLVHVCDAFALHRDEIDELNVFPVPDGDTGTNLLLTVRTALEETELVDDDPDPTGGHIEEAEALARGTVMAARGNSGVILSQVVRALAETLRERGTLDTVGLADWLDRAREHAYEAVANPVEGTMLTAVRAAADRARRAARGREPLQEAIRGVVDGVSEAVARSPEQLDVLREAGVVDAGARGFEVLCVTLHRIVCGAAPTSDPPPIVARAGPVATREAGSLSYRFEVQYLLGVAADGDPRDLRRQLERIGDSVVVSPMADLWNVHVHTNEIGAAIEAGLAFGTPSRIEVTSFADQIADREADGGRGAGRGVGAADGPSPERGAGPGGPADPDVGGPDALGCVAVVPGEGLHELVEAHGAVAVDGTAGQLPSVATLLNGIGRTTGEIVVVLPGHPNIVPTARQAVEVSRAEGGREIRVVDAAVSPGRTLAALAVWDAGGDADAIIGEMGEAAAAGTSGEVVAAVRDADTPIGAVRRGENLAIRDGEVIGRDADPVAALTTLARACGVDSAEVINLIVGADVDPDERERAVAALRHLGPGVELEVIDGRQRPARYHLGVE